MGAIQDILDNSIAHEQVADDVEPALTIAAWAGLGLLALEGILVWFGQDATSGFASWPIVNWAFTGLSHPGLVIVSIVVLLSAGLILAAVTDGFRRANRLGQSSQLGLLAAGAVAALPLLWVATVALAILVAIVGCVAAVVVGVAAVLDA